MGLVKFKIYVVVLYHNSIKDSIIDLSNLSILLFHIRSLDYFDNNDIVIIFVKNT